MEISDPDHNSFGPHPLKGHNPRGPQALKYFAYRQGIRRQNRRFRSKHT